MPQRLYVNGRPLLRELVESQVLWSEIRLQATGEGGLFLEHNRKNGKNCVNSIKEPVEKGWAFPYACPRG